MTLISKPYVDKTRKKFGDKETLQKVYLHSKNTYKDFIIHSFHPTYTLLLTDILI